MGVMKQFPQWKVTFLTFVINANNHQIKSIKSKISFSKKLVYNVLKMIRTALILVKLDRII